MEDMIASTLFQLELKSTELNKTGRLIMIWSYQQVLDKNI